MQGAKLKATKTPTLTEVALKVGDRYFALHGGSLYTLNCDSDGNVLNADYVATLPSFATNGVQWFKDRGQWIDNSATPSPMLAPGAMPIPPT